jgi:hypothetical protein
VANDLSDYTENKLYDHLVRDIAYTKPGVLYLALFTAVTDAEAGTGTELTPTGYARQSCAMGAPTNGAGSNTGVLTFGPLTVSTGTATHAALFDASTAGNAITAITALAASKTWAIGDSIVFAVGAVTFSMA